MLKQGEACMTITTPHEATKMSSASSGDSEPVQVSGILDARANQAFVRTSGYRRGRNDVYVSAAFLRENGLRTGDHIEGTAHFRRRRRDGSAARPDQDKDQRSVLDQ